MGIQEKSGMLKKANLENLVSNAITDTLGFSKLDHFTLFRFRDSGTCITIFPKFIDELSVPRNASDGTAILVRENDKVGAIGVKGATAIIDALVVDHHRTSVIADRVWFHW
jgi:hypothetical protein